MTDIYSSLPLNKNSFYGVARNTNILPESYLIGEWVDKGEHLYFEGLEICFHYTGSTIKTFSVRHCAFNAYEPKESVKIIGDFEFIRILQDLNNLFDNIFKWCELLPTSHLEMNDLEYHSPGEMYSKYTICICKNICWDDTMTFKYANFPYHISYFIGEHQNESYFRKEKDFKFSPAVNSFHGFSELDLSQLVKSCTIKPISLDSYNLIHEAIENSSYWIFRKVREYFRGNIH